MLGVLIAVTFLLFAYIGKINNKTWANPGSLYCLEWSLISFLAAIRLFGLYEASLKTWSIIFIGTVLFMLGIIFGKKLKINPAIVQYDDIDDSPSFMSDKMFWFLVILLFVLLTRDIIQTFSFWRAGYDLNTIREASVGMSSIDSYTRRTGVLAEWITLIKTIVEIFIVANAIDCFLYDSKKNKSKIIVALCYELLNSFTTGGRFSLAFVMLEILGCLMLYKLLREDFSMQISAKTIKWVKLIVLLMAVAIIVMSILRGAQVSELIKKYYRYICGNIVFMDLHIKEIDSYDFWACSFSGIFGFWSKFLPSFHRLGFDYPDVYLKTIDLVMNTQEFLMIGEKMPTNAFITPFYHLYADFRYMGVAFGMFIFGAFAGNRYISVIKTKNRTQLVFYLIVIQIIFKTLQNYPLSNSIYFFTIIFIVLFNYLKKSRE